MQKSLARMSYQFFPVCRFVLNPTYRFIRQSINVLLPRNEYLIGIRRGVYSMLVNSHRNYIVGVDQTGERPRNGTENDSITRNKKITNFGKEGKWREILQLADREKNQFDNVNWATAFSQLGTIRNLDRSNPLFKSFVNEYADSFKNRGIEWAGIQEVATVVYAIGKMQLKGSATRRIIGCFLKKESVRKLFEERNAQEIANSAWAFAKMEFKAPKLFVEIEKCGDWLVLEGTPQTVANTAWAVKHFQYYSPKLMKEINLRGEWLVKEGTAQTISDSAIALATCGCDATTFFAAVVNNVSNFIEYGEPQHIINVCYAMAILDLGMKHSDAFDQLWNTATELNPALLTNEAARQLAEVFAFCTADGMTLRQPSDFLIKKAGKVVPSRSKFQGEVGQILGQLNFHHEEEVSPLRGNKYDNGMLLIDIACKSHMLAFEYDGESRFLKKIRTGDATHRVNGATIAKRRFLQKSGWTVVSIDFRDWMEAKKRNSRQELLYEKLHQEGML